MWDAADARKVLGEARDAESGTLRGEIIYHPYLRGPNGDVLGVFRYLFQSG